LPKLIVDAVAHAGHVTVAQQIVAAIDVEHAAHTARQIIEAVFALEQRGDARGHAAAQTLERAMHVGRVVEQHVTRPRFVVARVRQHLFEEV